MFHHYIITRFSVLDKKAVYNPYFTRKKDTIEKYLFNYNRLNDKFFRFKKVTYPSILKQTHQNFTWLIYSSKHMPEKYKQKLLRFKNDKILIKFVENLKEMMEDINNHIKTKKSFSTIRIDDDDGLNPEFLETLEKYKDDVGTAVSFPNGTLIKYRGRKIISEETIHYKKIATGMSGIGINIYMCNHLKFCNHLKIDNTYPIIYDTLENAYIVSCSDFGNSRRRC